MERSNKKRDIKMERKNKERDIKMERRSKERDIKMGRICFSTEFSLITMIHLFNGKKK